MQSSTAAGRYAKALFSLAKEERRLSEVREELTSLGDVLAQNSELHDALMTPLYPADERKAVLVAIIKRGGLSPLFQNFCSYLIDQRRLVDFEGICEEFGRLADEDAGLMTAQVVSANPLDDRRKDRLRRALSERTGREVRLEVELDASLIGGAIAKVGDLVFDGSIRTQLSQLRANLMKGSS
jgi:F-type H+-transporting ATPase subunit delta